MKTEGSVSPKSLLIIFYRNPESGKVKTRLAATLGDSAALRIYLHMVAHTKSSTKHLPVDKAVFYSQYIDTEDNWDNGVYQKQIQSGIDLGERMLNAFRNGFQSGYRSICIVGTDCLELTAEIIEEAFYKLLTNDCVIGPARDGGYYLLGMNTLQADLFKNKLWSTSAVYSSTLDDFKMLGLKFFELPVLTDVDEEKDLPDDLKNLK